MSLLLDPNLVSLDEDFKYACGDSEVRQFVEELWERYKDYADKDFTQKIALEFHNRFWEMYLACTLKNIGYDLLAKAKTEGPDIGIRNADTSRIWVEAIAASPGRGADKIPLSKHDKIWFRVPEEQIVLRYTTAIDAKYKQYLHYRKKNIIAKSEPYVIAVNGNKVPYAWDWDDEIPYIVQAVLPFGQLTDTGYAHRSEIKKRNNGAVSTNIFLRREYEGISGIIFSRVGVYELFGEMGRDFIFVHNPLASNRVSEGWLRVGREYRVEGSSLECRRWSSKLG